jgi:hypothetical protein
MFWLYIIFKNDIITKNITLKQIPRLWAEEVPIRVVLHYDRRHAKKVIE